MDNKTECHKMMGVYKIVNKVNGKVYIGSTIDFQKRWDFWLYGLNKGEAVVNLQQDWDKYGSKSFDWVVIEDIKAIKDRDDLLKREQYYLDQVPREKCYNNKFLIYFTMTYNGKTQSVTKWSRELGIRIGILTNRKNRGWNDKKIFETPVNDHIVKVNYQGEERVVYELAKEFGIASKALKRRLERGIPIEQALEVKIERLPSGEPIYEASKRTGTPVRLIRQRMKKNGLSEFDALHKPIHQFYELNGKKQTLRQWAKEYGMEHGTLWQRITKLNFTLEEALNTPVEKLYEYDGRKQLLKQWAEEYGIAYKTLWYRIHEANYTLHEALHKKKRKVGGI